MNLIRRLFPFRTCTLDIHEGRAAIERPCLLYHIKRCQAPCVGYIDKSDYRGQIEQWRKYFDGSTASRGLAAKTITDPQELRELVAFFAWTAWGAAARMPGKDYSYTQNFPFEPLLGNGPSGEAVLWSALSLITLLAGTGVVLLAFGRFDLLGWKGRDSHVHPQLLPGRTTSSQRATLKFFVVVALLFLVQVLVGGGLAHYHAQPGSFYGFDLAAYLPSNPSRTRPSAVATTASSRDRGAQPKTH